MAAYATAEQIQSYCQLLEVTDLNDEDLLEYAEGEDRIKLNPILWKQYDLEDIVAAVTAGTQTGEFVKRLSAKLGALAACRGQYTASKNNALKSKFEALEDDTNNTLRQIKIGEIRL